MVGTCAAMVSYASNEGSLRDLVEPEKAWDMLRIAVPKRQR